MLLQIIADMSDNFDSKEHGISDPFLNDPNDWFHQVTSEQYRGRIFGCLSLAKHLGLPERFQSSKKYFITITI